MKPQPRYHRGERIANRYLVHQALLGGMGEVYLCLDLEENYPYALKTFQQRYLTDPHRLRQAFEQEAATWVALEKHPNIVRCFYLDILDNQPFLILEWIANEEGKGADLRSWLQRGPLDLRLALDFTFDICQGLIHAYSKQPGLVHRDLKPENILVGESRLAKITDFGLAKIIQTTQVGIASVRNSNINEQQRFKRMGDFVGTPAYMAPEQWLGKETNERTDIYAIGCILYEAIMGQPPFNAATHNDLRKQHMEASIPKLRRGKTPPSGLGNSLIHWMKQSDNKGTQNCIEQLNYLLSQCLAKQPSDRFTSVTNLYHELSLIYQQQFFETPKVSVTNDEFTALDFANRGKTYAEMQHHDEALADYTRAITLDPGLACVYGNRGGTYSSLGRYEEALADLNRSIQLEPSYAHAYNNLGVTYDKLQHYQEALANYNQAIQLNTTFAQAYYNRGITYSNLKYYEKALVDFNHAIQLDPFDAQAYSNRGIIYDELGDYRKALTDYNQAIQFDPTYATAYINRGSTYYNLENYREAIEDYNQAIRIEPNSPMAYFNLGRTYTALHRFDKAMSNYNLAIQLNPTDPEAYNNRGAVYESQQLYNEALIDYRYAIRVDPAFALAYRNLGALLGNLGMLQEALPYFEEAARLGDIQGAQNARLVKKMLKTR